MSALAMVLAAGMALGNGPEKVSGEMVQGLDLRGEWAGDWWLDTDKRYDVTKLGKSLFGLRMKSNGVRTATWLNVPDIVDEGHGRLRGRWDWRGVEIHGIYQQDGRRLVICFVEINRSRPTSFLIEDGQCLLILRRVKPAK
jgi:hypothetical protein